MIGFIVKTIFFVFWILTVGFSVYFFYVTAKTISNMHELWGFIVLYSFVIMASTIVSFSVIFARKEK